jgi:ribose transport system ATP-binding protein
VAIARAMRDLTPGSGLIILDESTRALSGADLEHIHQLLRRIAADGSSALMVSHSLSELMAVTDRMTVLRDGRVAGGGMPTSGLSEQELARRMLGSSVEAVTPRAVAGPQRQGAEGQEGPADPGRPAVTVTGLNGPHLADVSFSVARGEILGLTGLPGSGYEDIAYLVSGAQRAVAGELRTGSAKVNLARGSVAACLAGRRGAGARAPGPRRPRLRAQHARQHQPARARQAGPAVVRRAPLAAGGRRGGRRDPWVSGPAPRTSWSSSSVAGNQQKVLLAKWLNTGPALLVLHEPTQAVDIGARTDILHALQRAANTGTSILLVSSEPEDLVATCDRILVYGREVGLRQADAATPEQLIEEIYATSEATAGSLT